ncbi:sporulation membrane protein YtrI [Ornithinibacillus xuwenensis]|uniref:Sporulation membrane protein YtrI n=1 Tax=Ornithinibacillus xuwenensis TaxID=3144668 RepID=A0ABU9XBE4_9BACI
MHVPPYHKKPGWQRFLVGIFFGALLAYWVVMFMYGTMYERLLEENSSISKELDDAQSRIEVLEKDNEKSNQPTTVEEVHLEILNAEELKLDTLLQHQLEKLVKEEVEAIIGKDIQAIAENDDLLVASIENKPFKVDDFTYNFEIRRLIIAPTVKIVTNADISN